MNLLAHLYGPFFSLKNWSTVVTSWNDLLVIFSLVVMECLLSVDNAVVLAAQTQVLPSKLQREKSLFYGLWGAYLYRFLVIGIGVYLINFWPIKIIGGIYLLYLVFAFFRDRKKKRHRTETKSHKHKHLSLFWSTVLQIEFMDAIFSVDSVLAALAVSSNPVIVLIGGMIGILVMRFVAEGIMFLMRQIPELKPMAYVLIAIIAIKLMISIPSINIEMPPSLFGVIVLVLIVVTVGYHFAKPYLKGRN
ncbi:TerC family protein [Philodulcilactobacillus myokoensis]|uniref:TerC family protein n=1 Tax=Philodulcilactobacillus myokoensis TaxID=2929573 RepID=UPI0035A24413